MIVPYNKPSYVIPHVAWGFVSMFDNVLWLPSHTFDVLNLCIVVVGVVSIIFLTVDSLLRVICGCGPNDQP